MCHNERRGSAVRVGMQIQLSGVKFIGFVVVVTLLLGAIVWRVSYLFSLYQNDNILEVSRQPLAETMVIDHVTIGYPGGGYIVISGNQNARTVDIAVPAYFTTGTYGPISIPLLPYYQRKGLDTVGDTYRLKEFTGQPGSFIYVRLYGESDGKQGFSPKDRLLKDIKGRPLVKTIEF